jgi:hypothetical protein
MRNPFLLIIFGFLFITRLFSQNPGNAEVKDAPLRIEIPARSDMETHRVIPCGKEGVMVFFRSLEQVDAKHVNWYFTWYDQNLQQIWVKRLPLLSDQEYISADFQNDTLSLLFFHAGKRKESQVDFGVLRILMASGTFIFNPGKVNENQEVVYFSVDNNNAWIGLHGSDGMDRFLFMNLRAGSIRFLSLGEGNALSIRWAGANTGHNAINAVVTRRVGKNLTENYLVRYDTLGVILSETVLTTGSPDLQFTHFKACQTGSSDFMVLGGYVQGAPSRKRSEELVSTGFFSLRVLAGAQKSVMFYNFLELKNAGSLLNEKDVMTLRKKSLKKGSTKKAFSLDYPLVFKDPLTINNQFILQSEVYSPQFRTENFTDFDFYGRPYTNSYSVFDGFRFQSAIVAGFDLEGKLVWDNVLEIRNLLSHEATPKMTIYPDGSDLVLAYLSDGKIGFKIIKGNSVLEKLSYNPLELLYPEDKLLSESRSRMTEWYDNYYLCFGYQEIKNISLASNNKRLVFFINKVRFNP